jgi:hypothetical protein
LAHADMPDLDRLERGLAQQHPEIPAAAVQKAFTYYASSYATLGNQAFITIINFNLPSTIERMSVIDMSTGQAESYLVAHGKNSGLEYATQFSDEIGSDMSSLGIYLTGTDYIGEHGLSMRLQGMEDSNRNAEVREIVMHAADYVSSDWIKENGYLGRSWGCPAIEQRFRDKLVGQLKNGSVFLIYRD